MLTDLNQWRVAPQLRWDEAFALWLKQTPTQRNCERAENTLSGYLGDVRVFGKWFKQEHQCDFSPELLNATDLKAYFGLLEEDGKANTYNRKLVSIKMLIKWAQCEGILDSDPSEWIPQMNATPETPRDIPDDDRLALERVADSGAHLGEENEFYRLRDSLIFWLMGNAGLRIHETVGLKLSDLHLEQGYIHVLGKGKKHRTIKVKAGKLVEVIRAWMAIMPKSLDGMLLTDINGGAITRCTAWRRFGLIAETAGVQATPHMMRHTFINRILDECERQGMRWQAALKFACLQTGDTPEVILAYYTNPRESEMFAIMERL